MGQMSWFGRYVQPIVNCAKRGHVARFFANLGRDWRWKNIRISSWSRNSNWLGIYSQSTWHFEWRNVDVVNAIIKKQKPLWERLQVHHAFVENELWSVVCMKENFHARFITILQIIYQQERSSYFSNQIIITFDLANKWKPIKWCSIVLTQLLVELTC
jgi:hypothetical protein